MPIANISLKDSKKRTIEKIKAKEVPKKPEIFTGNLCCYMQLVNKKLFCRKKKRELDFSCQLCKVCEENKK